MRTTLTRLARALSPAAVVACALTLTAGSDAATPPGQTGQFNTPCGFSHRRSDDPIVFPGRPGASHSHDFLGNASTDAHSTLASLRAAATTCRRPQDRSAYWAPTLYLGDTPVRPGLSNAYYRTAGRDPGSIVPFPAGLELVAGHSKARGPQPRSVTEWACAKGRVQRIRHRGTRAGHRRALRRALVRLRRRERALRRGLRALRRARAAGDAAAVRRHRRAVARDRGAIRALRRAIRRERLALRAFGRGNVVPTCPSGRRLVARIRFPDCWDGRRLDSSDHASHLSYARWSRSARRNVCPASHPVAVPKLVLDLRYPIAGGEDVRLSSGPAYTMHADFFNAWDEDALRDLVRRCLNADVHCGAG